MVIDKFLNQKNSLRDLSDDEFERLLPHLAEELSQVDYRPSYTEEELLKDWKKLLEWKANVTSINSTSRIGMKLCEHFFPNFYDIEDRKGNSFKSLWSDTDLLQKVLRWNRKSHSTPYLSELKRGIYFCGNLCKSTMYRPQMAKMVTLGSESVLDPCAGWGGRMLGAVANGCKYIAFEPNTETYNGLSRLVEFLSITENVVLFNDDALTMNDYIHSKVDCVITSPPYFDLEVYSHESTQSIIDRPTYQQWNQQFLTPLIHTCADKLRESGKSCWNVAKVDKNDMWDSVAKAHEVVGYSIIQEYEIVSSARQVNQSRSKNKKSVDRTVVYGKKSQ